MQAPGGYDINLSTKVINVNTLAQSFSVLYREGMGKRGPEKQYPARLHVATTHEQIAKLRQAATAKRETVSEYVRRLVAKALDTSK